MYQFTNEIMVVLIITFIFSASWLENWHSFTSVKRLRKYYTRSNKPPDVISAQLICIHTSWRARDAFPLWLTSINCLIVVRQTAQARSGRLPEQRDPTLSPGWVTGPSVASAVMPAPTERSTTTHEYNNGGQSKVKWWNCETGVIVV